MSHRVIPVFVMNFYLYQWAQKHAHAMSSCNSCRALVAHEWHDNLAKDAPLGSRYPLVYQDAMGFCRIGFKGFKVLEAHRHAFGTWNTEWNLYHKRVWNQVLLFKPPTHATSKHLRATVRLYSMLHNSPCKIYRGFHDHGWKRLDRYLRGTQHKVQIISLNHLSWVLILNTCIQNSVEQRRR